LSLLIEWEEEREGRTAELLWFLKCIIARIYTLTLTASGLVGEDARRREGGREGGKEACVAITPHRHKYTQTYTHDTASGSVGEDARRRRRRKRRSRLRPAQGSASAVRPPGQQGMYTTTPPSFPPSLPPSLPLSMDEKYTHATSSPSLPRSLAPYLGASPG